MPQPDPNTPFEFTSSHLALDFANTADYRAGECMKDRLTDYPRLLEWGIGSATINQETGDRLLRLSRESPGTAQATLRRALHLREAIFQLFSAVANRRGVPGSSLAVLNAAARQASEHSQLEHANRRFLWRWVEPESSLDAMLWPVSRAAVDLLASEEVAFVRHCASENCDWLFLDTSKNHRRRWCDMKVCGNRDKARRYYRRQKAG